MTRADLRGSVRGDDGRPTVLHGGIVDRTGAPFPAPRYPVAPAMLWRVVGLPIYFEQHAPAFDFNGL